MSLNIDMKMIPGFSLILDMNSWTLLQSCKCGESREIFHSNSIGSPSIVSNVLYCGELLNHVNLSSQTVFDCGFWFIFPKHNTESEKYARMGNHAKRVQVRCAQWTVRTVFSAIRLGPKTSECEKYVSVKSTAASCDVTNCATTSQGFQQARLLASRGCVRFPRRPSLP